MRITICGHASVMVEEGADRVLVDPVFSDTYASGTMAFHPARNFALSLMPRPSAIVVTHAHIDHFDPPSLARLAKDTPIIVPKDGWLAIECTKLGFTRVIELEPWTSIEIGALKITATPSEFDWEEIGLLFADASGATYWHMSDSIVQRDVGARIKQERGPITAVAARYQPVQVLPGYLRGLGSSFDERALVVEWLEACAETEPRFVFPYAWAVAYVGRHAWANKYLGPWSQPEIVDLFRRRLPSTTATEVRPGDVLALDEDRVTHERRSSAWVQERPSPAPDPWEPIDASTLGAVAPIDRALFVAEAHKLLEHEVAPFLAACLAHQTNPFSNYVRWGVVWQAVIHLGADARFEYAIDFRDLTQGAIRHPEANAFTHLSGEALQRVLAGTAGTEIFWMSGDVRQYEKIISIEHGKFSHPPLEGWALLDALPDPITLYLRKFRAR